MSTKIQNRFRSLVFEVVALIILVPLSIFLFTKISNHQQERALVTVPTQSSSPIAEANQTAKPETVTSTVPSQEITNLEITLNISSLNKSSSYKIQTDKPMSVIDVMKIAESKGMTLKTKDYGAPLGMLVEAINNIENDSKNQKYWTLYVNDKMSVTGASSTIVNPGETVTWKFENTTL